MAKGATTELVPFKDRFALAPAGANMGELLKANLGGEEIRATDILERIKVPGSGGQFWTVQTLDGEKPEKFLEGIIVYTNRRRAYWPNKDVTGKPPACASDDCLTGHGDPGGDCMKCPLNAFGSGTKQDGTPAKGKACKEVRQLFFLMPGRELPVVIGAPPGSLRTMRDYLAKELTMMRKVPYFACITRLGLTKEKNEGGTEYSRIVPSFVEALDAEAMESIKAYAASLQPIFAATELQPDETLGD